VSGSTDWQQLSKITAEPYSYFGSSVAVSGSTMEFVIGGQFPHSSPFPSTLRRAVHDAIRTVVIWPPSKGRSTHT
jgi:hypothetical protein